MRSATVGDTVWAFIDSLETRTSPSNEGGWTHYDASAKPTAWHIDTFLGCQNHSWWCGIIDSSWIYDSNRAGYDNDWIQYLQNKFPTNVIPPGTPVKLSFRHHFDAEPGYDYGYVEVNDLDWAVHVSIRNANQAGRHAVAADLNRVGVGAGRLGYAANLEWDAKRYLKFEKWITTYRFCGTI